MNLQILKISPILNHKIFEVMVKIDQAKHQFTMTVETEKLGNQSLQIIQGDDRFHLNYDKID